MPIGPGGLDSNGIWQFGEDDSEALASDLLNLGMGSVSTAISTLGGVLQVVSTTKTDTFSVSLPTDTISGDVTGLTAVITPSSSSSKVLVRYSLSLASSQTGAMISILNRGGGAIGVGDAASSRTRATAGGVNAVDNAVATVSGEFLDSPSSTSELTYSVRLAHSSANTHTMYINRSRDDINDFGYGRYVSTITAEEVAG